MVGWKRSLGVGAGVVLAALSLPSPSYTQAPPLDTDALITPALKVDSGIALARRQIGENDLLGALGTLERVLIANGDVVAPRLLYASLLCRLDDRQGAEVEISLLPRKAVPDANWAEVTEACGPLPRPDARKSKR